MFDRTYVIRPARKVRAYDVPIAVVDGAVTLVRQPAGRWSTEFLHSDPATAALAARGYELALDLPYVGVLSLHPVQTGSSAPTPAPPSGPLIQFLTGLLGGGAGSPPPQVLKEGLRDLGAGRAVHYGGLVVVRFEAPPTDAQWDSIQAAAPFRLERRLVYATHAYVLRPEAPLIAGALRLVDACYDLVSTTANAYPVLVGGTENTHPDPLPEEWHLGGLFNAAQGGVDTGVADAWRQGFRGQGVRVAAFERGSVFQRNHVQLDGAFDHWVDATQGPQDPPPGGDPWPPPTDNLPDATARGETRPHATMVAGLIAARGRPQKAADGSVCTAHGSAPESRLVGLFSGGGLGSLDEADAFVLAVRCRADVINCSWNLPRTVPGHHVLAPHTDWAIAFAASKGRGGLGCPILFAAGNGAAKWGQTAELSGYNRHPDVLCIGSCTNRGQGASYSNPGRPVLCVFPMGDEDAGGSMVRALDLEGEAGQVQGERPRADYLSTEGATSGSCAATSGVVALILQAGPKLTRDQVRDVLASSAVPLGQRPSGGDVRRPFGFGSVHAGRAVNAARAHGSGSTSLSP